jgi:transposase
MVMTTALLVYSIAQRRLRQRLNEQEESIPNQINQPTDPKTDSEVGLSIIRRDQPHQTLFPVR